MGELREHFYPETAVGGYTRIDGSVEFYLRVSQLITPESVVLDYGAGRGRFVEEDDSPLRRDLHRLQGRSKHVVGVDVDPAVLANPTVDEAHVIEPGGRLPLEDASVDVIVSDWTFEHVTAPEATAAELGRVLKPGGWLAARTPNKWGYIGMAARAVPNAAHVAALRKLQPRKAEEDTFDVAYAMNTREAIRRLFPSPQFEDHSYEHDPEPAYAGGSRVLWSLTMLSTRVLPRRLGAVRLIFVQKAS